MIVSIGLSLALRYTYQFFYRRRHPPAAGRDDPADIHLGPVSLSWIDVVEHGHLDRRAPRRSRSSCCAPASARRRARSPTTRASPRRSGIDVDRVIRIVWVHRRPCSPALSGILWAYFRPGVKWDMGSQILLLIFAAVTLGGLGTAFGALVGSIIVGLLVELSTLWMPSDLKYVGALVVLILVLLFRPQGILGRRERIG